ncbi:unnamed protein product [Caenorhabditis angaria]|uniref:RNA-polymerase II-associated protein 3-like C-terminal domain-containing protein n=1 Tax=Caenorhabditis angaria TaxID=860376 RepID=A0A9P1IPV1_9PELO|nr:unnamed protein product [Caenorhabditis angaria]
MDCTEAISMDPTIFKNFYRRAVALKNLGIFEEAEKDLKKCLELTNNQAATALLQEVRGKKNLKIIEMFATERDDYLSSNEKFEEIPIVCEEPSTSSSTSQEIIIEAIKEKAIPKRPMNYGEFATSLVYLQDQPIVLAKYFMEIDPNRYHFLFDDLINDGQASDIFYALSQYLRCFPQNSPEVAERLLKLAEVERFDMLIMFLRPHAKGYISDICKFLSEQDSKLVMETYLKG